MRTLKREPGQGLDQIKALESTAEFDRLWGAETFTLHLWVGGSKASPANKKLTFELQRKVRTDIAWPT